MSYRLNAIIIRTNNNTENKLKVNEIWCDIASGKIPILFDSENNFQQGISPIIQYSNYASDNSENFDLSIMGVTSDFFKNMELNINKGSYKKYEADDKNGNIGLCSQKAWEKVWEDQRHGKLKRTFTSDYESSVPPEFTKDGKAHCYLYVAVER